MDGLNPRKVFSLVFIIGIAVVFTLSFGPGSSGFGGTGAATTAPGSVATVNGKEIPMRDFATAWARQMNFLRSQGSPIPESVARQFGMHTQVLDRLVNTELLAQAAERHGITASDDELRKLIHQNPDFQKDGVFDMERYKQVLRDFYRKTAPDFETELRRQLGAQKMLDVVRANAVVSDDEVRARYEKQGNQAKVVFARFLPTMFAEKVPAPTPAQLAEWKKAHEKEIKDYFEANRFVYQQPERIHARQVLVKLAPDATAEQKAQAKAKAEALRKEIEGGKDFAAVAKESSEDPGSKARGGDLGWVERGSWEPALADAAFALKAGEVTQPVETKFGVHLVKVEEKQAAQDKKLEDVSDEIATTLYKQDRAKEQARAEAEKALASVKGGKTLKELFPSEKEQPALLRFETETRPEAVETDSFTAEGEAVPHLGPAPELVKAVFAVSAPQPLDQVFPVGEGFVVTQVVERQKPDTAGFDKRKDELRTQAQQAKQIELTESFLKSLKKTGTVVTNTEAIDSVVGAG
ncbi:peptidylprolyl isomerase [Pyxidicoccus caerfyrddinensis]|uniref:peptidylprolyl isomerase n=1 Tax=Pyxidicoccus caerfyrddinensis TaxID=2709663 RepID=UPI0019685A6D|nr:peptidylprolyl isomerase [Pyxidicoccus caerfyrddinensis]